MAGSGSVTRLIHQLRSDDPQAQGLAAQEIWRRYFPPLLQLACRKLHEGIRRREDEEDVLQSMYKSFCLRQQRGDFDLVNRDELWQLLVTITLRKVRNVAKHHQRQGRDYRRDQQGAAAPESPRSCFEEMEGSDPTPEEAALLNEQLERRLEVLPESLRQIALWKFEGYTNEEIAGPDMLNCAPRTVERKLALIRQLWGTKDEDEPHQA